MFSVVTANVNGVRAAIKRGGFEWFKEQNEAGLADVICLQEVRASDEQLRDVLEEAGMSHFNVAHSASEKKGHAGVAILSLLPLNDVQIGLGPEEFANQGRWVEATIATAAGPVRVASVYVHTGDHEKPEKQAEKELFLASMTADFARRMSEAGPKSHHLIVGDLNVGHTENDIKNWKGNIGKSGFLESERVHFSEWFNTQGWRDLGRDHAGEIPGPYTWWSFRGQAFDNDAGWRIDYQVATPHLAKKLVDVRVGRADSYAARWSDHAPVTAVFDTEAKK